MKTVVNLVDPTLLPQASYIMGLSLPSLTRFKAMRPIEVKTDNIRLGYRDDSGLEWGRGV